MAKAVAIRLFLFGNDDRCRKQAVADAITLSCPGHAIIDDVSVHRCSISKLPDLNPVICLQDGQGCPDCALRASNYLGKRHLGDHDSIMIPEPGCQCMHDLSADRRFGDKVHPGFMGGPFGLDPGSLQATFWELFQF